MRLSGLKRHKSTGTDDFFMAADIIVLALTQYLTSYYRKEMSKDTEIAALGNKSFVNDDLFAKGLEETASAYGYTSARFLLAQIPEEIENEDSVSLMAESVRDEWNILIPLLDGNEAAASALLVTAAPEVNDNDLEQLKELIVYYLRAKEEVFNKLHGKKYRSSSGHYMAVKLLKLYTNKASNRPVEEFNMYVEGLLANQNTFLRSTLDNLLG
jgi:hypothetical protein